MNNKANAVAVVVLFGVLTGCNSSPQKPASEPSAAQSKPAFQPTYYTGREAIQKMYIAARSWAPDAKPFRLESQPTKDSSGQDGKAGVWRAGFASASKGSLKTFSWSGIKADDAPDPGISASSEDTYNPSSTSTTVFDFAFLKVDTDKALDEANKHGGDKLIKKDTAMQVQYTVDWYARQNKLLWHVAYGGKNDPKLNVAVDATTGSFLRVEK